MVIMLRWASYYAIYRIVWEPPHCVKFMMSIFIGVRLKLFLSTDVIDCSAQLCGESQCFVSQCWQLYPLRPQTPNSRTKHDVLYRTCLCCPRAPFVQLRIGDLGRHISTYVVGTVQYIFHRHPRRFDFAGKQYLFRIPHALTACRKSHSADAERYHRLARAALQLRHLLAPPSLDTVYATLMLAHYQVNSGKSKSLHSSWILWDTCWFFYALSLSLSHKESPWHPISDRV